MSSPVSHLQEAQKLTADAPIDLFIITLKLEDVVYRFRNGKTVTWQGNEYEGTACRLTGDRRNSDGEESRPTLQLLNPLGIFNKAAMDGRIDYANVVRKRVLLGHLDANVNIYEQRMFYVGRVRELISSQSITLELRNMTEGPNFEIPARMYTPDQGFPIVTL